jgi:multiple sugar transport system permease protein
MSKPAQAPPSSEGQTTRTAATERGPRGIASARFKRGWHQRSFVLALLFIAPALVLRLFTSVYPFLSTAHMSLTDASLLTPVPQFVGLDNYVRLSNDAVLRESVSFTVLFVVGSTVIELVLGLLIALLLTARIKVRSLGRSVNLIPWAIPAIVAALGFRFMFDADFGIIPDLLGRVGVHIEWLTNSSGARAATIIANVWRSTPFVALILLAGLQGIPKELYEAARVDGASPVRILWRIVIPLVTPLLVTMGVFLLIWQLGTFDIILGMTGGGPGSSTTVLSYLAYQQAFVGLEFGYASAIAIVLFFFVLLAGILALVLFRRTEVHL